MDLRKDGSWSNEIIDRGENCFEETERFVFLSTINVNFGWKTGSKRNFEFVEGYDRSGFV